MSIPSMFDYLNSILVTGEDLMTSPEAIKVYEPFVMNRWLAQYNDCVLIASEANRLGITDKRMHYDFVRASIRKRKRYVKWVKKEKPSKDLEIIQEYYNVGMAEAIEYSKMIPVEHLKFIKDQLDNGGNNKHK